MVLSFTQDEPETKEREKKLSNYSTIFVYIANCYNMLQLNLYQTELLFRYVFHDLTRNCLLTSEDLPGFTMICRKMLTKLFLF